MPSTTISVNLSVAGVSINGTKSRSADSAIGYELVVPQARAGALTTRSSASAGEITLEAGHGITTAQVVDLYFVGGVRRDVTVGTVAGTAVPISGGTGDDLPAEDAAITVAPILEANVEIDGDNVIVVGLQHYVPAAGSAHRAFLELFTDVPGSIDSFDLVSNEPVLIDVEGGDTNPLASAVAATAKASSSYTGGTSVLRIAALIDSTP